MIIFLVHDVLPPAHVLHFGPETQATSSSPHAAATRSFRAPCFSSHSALRTSFHVRQIREVSAVFLSSFHPLSPVSVLHFGPEMRVRLHLVVERPSQCSGHPASRHAPRVEEKLSCTATRLGVHSPKSHGWLRLTRRGMYAPVFCGDEGSSLGDGMVPG
jgi:hypothetical protein